MPFSSFLDRGQTCAGRGTAAFKPTFRKLEHEGLGSRDAALDSIFADRHHLA
jgi:hypothetical protein